MSEAAQLLALLLLHLALTALPGAAATLSAARRGESRVPVLLAIGLAAGGLVAMLSFWAYYLDPLAGRSFSYFTLFAAALLVVLALRGGIDRALLRQLAIPLGLWSLGSAFLVYLGFLHGITDSAVSMSATRFAHQMPTDNDLPNFFAGWFYHHGHVGVPPVYPGGWTVGERPPLQTGYVLAQRPFGDDARGLNYEVLGVVLQQLWIVGLWALLLAARVGRIARALAMLAVLASGVAIVNGFYVWPKMLPVAFLLAAAALLVTPLWDDARHRLAAAALVAGLLALALLCHGTALFGVVALAAVAARRGLPSWRWLGVGCLVGIALLGPWAAYQKWGDPPGNRLVKWMLAGDPELDGRGTAASIVDAYREAGVGGALANKAANFGAMVGANGAPGEARRAADALGAGELDVAVEEVRGILFYHLLLALGPLLIGLAALLVGWRRARREQPEWAFAGSCLAVVLIGALVWGLVLFGNDESRTVLHQGTFLLPVLGICGVVAGLRAVYPRFALYLVPLAAAATVALYAPALQPAPGSAYSLWAALLSAFGLGGFVALAVRADGATESVNTLAR